MTDTVPAWPDDEPAYRLRPPAADEGAGLDALAAVLDATPRGPSTAVVRLAVGRRTDVVGPRRRALETLSGVSAVTVHDDRTTGIAPLTGECFEAIATLFTDVDRLLVRDDEDVAIAEWRDETLRFALPDAAVEALQSDLDGALVDRIEPLE
ncbi:hypothetical protein NDI56_11055 [Haloarcula sp. S1CR25-12]|uniref:Uncharacterized protein n=1 Tax=Haloarcula saliterrae TaxID=2950534 RepID=A0ABU2FCD8_9EURY|nr:hypothetical protein [Haloarcula sp. S1CR25-12]MDS0259932.1 hypothetical protein [Haloarcula sp. S1CR25-12]